MTPHQQVSYIRWNVGMGVYRIGALGASRAQSARISSWPACAVERRYAGLVSFPGIVSAIAQRGLGVLGGEG